MKVIAKEIKIWIEDSTLKKLSETELFQFASKLEKLTFVESCSANTYKQLIIAYDPDEIGLSELTKIIKLSLKSFVKDLG